MKGRLRAAFFVWFIEMQIKKGNCHWPQSDQLIQLPFKGLSRVIIAPTALPFNQKS